MEMEDAVSVKLCNQMIKTLEDSPDFEGELYTRCLIFLDSENPNPVGMSDLPGVMGALEDHDKIMSGELRLGDGYTKIYGTFHTGEGADSRLQPFLYVLQMITPFFTDLKNEVEGLDEVEESLEETVDLLYKLMYGEDRRS
jgi:hypothetical protein